MSKERRHVMTFEPFEQPEVEDAMRWAIKEDIKPKLAKKILSKIEKNSKDLRGGGLLLTRPEGMQLSVLMGIFESNYGYEDSKKWTFKA